MEFVKKEKKLGNSTTTGYFNELWGSIDPAPDLAALFRSFNHRFFKGKLTGIVRAEWADSLTATSAVSFRDNRSARNVTIYLSKPILQVASRKRILEILVHEMIHSFCFVLSLEDGGDGHGKNFKKIMKVINRVAGLKILPDHSLHNSLDPEKSYLWRCNGICQHRAPFVGFARVKARRDPGADDIWWTQHLSFCGGTFWQIKDTNKTVKSETTETKFKPLPPRSNDQPETVWSVVDDEDEVMVRDVPNEIIDISDHSDDDDDTACIFVPPETILSANISPYERVQKIKEDIVAESYVHTELSEIRIIDGTTKSTNTNNQKMIGDLFGRSSPCIANFILHNSVFDYDSPLESSQNDIVTCPICELNIVRHQFADHLNGCGGITLKIKPKNQGSKVPLQSVRYSNPIKKRLVKNEETKTVEVFNISSDDNDVLVVVEPLTDRQRRQAGLLNSSMHFCPVCGEEILVTDVDIHLLVCRKPRKSSS